MFKNERPIPTCRETLNVEVGKGFLFGVELLEVSSLFDPAKRSAAGGLTDLKLSLWSGRAGDGIDGK